MGILFILEQIIPGIAIVSGVLVARITSDLTFNDFGIAFKENCTNFKLLFK
ncbi:hypothetical protein VCRA2122O339_70137 [Vibrio crassostreae]|nr:hypothetical protein VCRA2122O339_70137 [Vibrio crassostreae]